LTRFEIINDKNSRQSSLRLSFMKRVVCLPQGSDRTEPLSRSLRGDIQGGDPVGTLEVGHDEPEFPGHDLGR
jgi:hypothetical protein